MNPQFQNKNKLVPIRESQEKIPSKTMEKMTENFSLTNN